MKKLLIFLGFALWGMMFLSSCSDDTFCIQDYSFETTQVNLEEVTFTLPNGEEYTGTGIMSFPLRIGDYDMMLSTTTISETTTENGATMTIVHYFYDNEGNNFWSKDLVTFTNVGVKGQATSTYNIDILDGRGDFECAEGSLTNEAFGNFITNKIDFKITGEVCGGCK